MGDRSLKELGFPDYWNKRYETGSEVDGEKLRPFLEKTLPKPSAQPRILHLGCGDSVRA